MSESITFSSTELKHLGIATLAIVFAFSLVLHSEEVFVQGIYSPMFLVDSLVIVGSAFILHEELGHKVAAQRYGCWAEFRAWPAGVMLTVLMAVFSYGAFVFAAPGAVMISQFRKEKLGFSMTYLSKDQIGKVGVAGSVVNLIVAVIFLGIYYFFPWSTLLMGAAVNAWLAVFNMLPFDPLDGAKVIRWNRAVWLTVIALGLAIMYTVPM
jgi:Zn-dependent protease